jgi:hypothetical protein
MVVAIAAIFVALGGTSAAAVYVTTAQNAKHLGGKPPSYYVSALSVSRTTASTGRPATARTRMIASPATPACGASASTADQRRRVSL